MAEASISVGQDQFSCPICLDLLKDPVAIPCGHSYCMGCIKCYWDGQNGVYSCPQCRQTFTSRPVLGRNTMLVEVVEKLKKTGLQVAPPAHCYAGPGDVECDFCIGRKCKADKSCLVCLVSYCETHIQPHYKVPGLKKHKLVNASTQLQEKICSQHDKLIEVFCRTDHQGICLLCMMDEHKGHDTVSAAAERTEKQNQLGATQRKSQQRIQEGEKELRELKQAVESLRLSAQAAVEDSERIFTVLIRSIERKCSEVKELIRAQEKAELSRAEGLLERLEQEIAELRRRDADLKKLSHADDHIHFLQSFQSLNALGSGDLPSITINPLFSFGDTKKSISELNEQLKDFCKTAIDNISKKVTEVQLIQHFEPKTRQDFLKYSCKLTLDPNSAHRDLCLSEGNREVTRSDKAQSYADHPERFDRVSQVLCRESLSGRCYWEVEWRGDGEWRADVYIAVSYKGISRKGCGNENWFGYNNQSWSLECSPFSYHYRQNTQRTLIPAPSSSRIGVYLDHRAGTLSFYSVSDTMTLLHRVQATFTQPLYPGFWVNLNTNVKFFDLTK